MAIHVNRGLGGLLIPPLGYPVTLREGHETMMIGVLPKMAETVTATFTASKTATVYMDIFAAPSSSGGSDGAPVRDYEDDGYTVKKSYQVSATATNTETTLTLTMPSLADHIASVYVVKLWAMDITGETEDTAERDTSITDTSTQAKIPGTVTVTEWRWA